MKLLQNIRNRFVAMFAFVMALVALSFNTASAQSDITGVLDELTTYKTAGIVIGVAILLFTLGRVIVRKLAK